MDSRRREMARAIAAGDDELVDTYYRMAMRTGDWGLWEIRQWDAALMWTRPARYVPIQRRYSNWMTYVRIPGRVNTFRTMTQCTGCTYRPDSDHGDWAYHDDGCTQPGFRTWELTPMGREGITPARQWMPVDYIHGPPERCIDLLKEIAALHWGYQGKQWQSDSGEFFLDGVRFVLLPSGEKPYRQTEKGKRYRGQHRFKIQCPKCQGLFGPAKFRQHIRRKDHQG